MFSQRGVGRTVLVRWWCDIVPVTYRSGGMMCSCTFKRTFNLLFPVILENSVRCHINVEKHLEDLFF